MSNKQKNSIEYLFREISDILGPLNTEPMQNLLLVDALQRAKKIHEEEIKESWEDGKGSFSSRNAEQYYNETFR